MPTPFSDHLTPERISLADRSDIPCRRFPDIRAIKVCIINGKTLATGQGATVVEVDDIVVKYGPRVYKSEALAMQLVLDATQVPVP